MKDAEKLTEYEIRNREFEKEVPKILHEKAQEIRDWAENARDLLEMAIQENEDTGKRFAMLNAVDSLQLLILNAVRTINDETPGPETQSYCEEKESLAESPSTIADPHQPDEDVEKERRH